MHDEPPVHLTALLARLKLATPEQVRAVRHFARGLARDLPLFESVWVDALVQARLLTPFQATEINAGRGEQLLVGPYLLRGACGGRLGWAECFVAVHRETKRTVHLLVQRERSTAGQASSGTRRIDGAIAELQEVVKAFRRLNGADSFPLTPPSPTSGEGVKIEQRKAVPHVSGISTLEAAGADGETLWGAFGPTTGFPASQWTAWHGRLTPMVVLEIARQMATALAALEKAGIGHGDIGATSVLLSEKGEVQLARCGVRGIFRRDENEDAERLPIEAFDYLGPERVETGSSPGAPGSTPGAQNMAGDMYACGCLWWHLLTGRAPMAGGNHADKFRAVQAGRFPDLQRLAPDVPKPLAAAIERCTQRDPQERPASFGELVQLLGPPNGAGRRKLADVLAGSGRRTLERHWSQRARSGVQRAGTQLLAAAACAMLVAAATWPLWRSRQPAVEHSVAARPAAMVNSANSGKITKVIGVAAVDPAVRQVNYQTTESAATDATPQVAAQLNAPAAKAEAARPVIELAGDTEIAGVSLRLQAGAIVRGKGDQRARIVTPPNGLIVAADNVRFENVDFLWRQRPEAITSPDRHAVVEVRSGHAEFVGCTFQAMAVGSFELPPAVRLSGSAQRAALAPAGQVKLERCAMQGVACGIDCGLVGPAAIEVSDTLHLGRGALVRFSQPRRGDAPAAVTLQHVTLRGATSAIEINCGEGEDELAPFTISASGCVFAPDDAGALLVFSGRRIKASTGGRLRGIEWLGEGSLAPPGAPVAIWRHDETVETLSDDELSIDGLVASAVEFVGPATNDPAASRVKKWAAPLQTEQTPGIGDDVPKLPSGEAIVANAGSAKQK